jgi:indole-3-glycerol phosphate synthase
MARPAILDEIIDWKRDEIARLMAAEPLGAVQAAAAGAPAPRDFCGTLRQPGVSLIAEIKRASPSKGLLHPNLDAVALAREYEAGGASAISVLTDERYFQGSLDDLRAVRQSVSLPVLRKDFVLEPYQVYQARAAGADAILLIVAALEDEALASLHELAAALGMAALVEVHSAPEMERALRVNPSIVGINNRDLQTFEVSLDTTAGLRSLLPAGVSLVSESGVHSHGDVARLEALGTDAILVGEALVRAPDAGDKIRELIGP